MDLHTLLQSVIPNRDVHAYTIDAEAEIIHGEPIVDDHGNRWVNDTPGANTFTVTADDAVYKVIAPLTA